MEIPVLQVEARQATGKSQTAKLRQRGLIPGVCYGAGRAPLPMALQPNDLSKILKGPRGMNSLIKLQGLSEERTVFVQEIQRHPVERNWLHVDFIYVDPQQPVVRRVPVELVGRPAGVKAGGVLQVSRRNIRVESLPAAVPEKVEVDVSNLEIGDSIHVEQLQLPEGVRAVYDVNYTICAVVAPSAEEEKPAAGAAAAEEAAPEGQPAEKAAATPDKEAATDKEKAK